MQHIKENRWTIISALIKTLKTKTERITVASRWGAWENGVLAKVGKFGFDVAAIQKLIGARQAEVDEETDEVGLIRDMFLEAIHQHGHDPADGCYFFKNDYASRIVTRATGKRWSKIVLLRMLRDLCNKIEELDASDDGRYGRGFCWTGEHGIEGELKTLLTPRVDGEEYSSERF